MKPKIQTKFTKLVELIKNDPNDEANKAIFKICQSIISEELEALREEIREDICVFHSPAGNNLPEAVFKAQLVERKFRAYLERINDDV